MFVAAACGGVSRPDGFAEPKVEGDVLFVSLDAGKLSALKSDDFSLLWEFPKDDNFACGEDERKTHDLQAIYGAPVVDGGRVYFGAYDGNVYALDSESGECVWESRQTAPGQAQCQREPDGPIVGGLALHEDLLYVGSDDGQLYVIDAETGLIRYCRDVGGAVWTTPLIADGVVYVATMKGAVWAIQTGEPHPQPGFGTFETSAGLLTDPVSANGKIIVGGIGEKLFALDAATGEEIWSFSGGNWFWGRPAVEGNTVYATNLDGKAYAIDLDTGESVWESNTFRADEAIRAGPLVLDGALVIVDRGGNIYTLDPDTGTVIKASEAIIEKRVLANPVEFDADVLVVDQDGNLYRVQPTGEEPPKKVQVVE